MSLKKTVDFLPSEANNYFIETKEYYEKRDEVWRNDMKDFTDHLKKNNDKYYRHNGCIVKMFMELKDIFGWSKPVPNIRESITSYPFIIPKGFKNWLKFLFYDCPKYSFSKPIRRKFLCQLSETCRLLATVWAVVFLLFLANDNYHLREKVTELQQTEQKYKLLRKASKTVNSWSDKADKIEDMEFSYSD